VSDGRGGTLAHRLAYVDHTRVLPRLRAGGVSLVARDWAGQTPAQRAAEVGAVAVADALEGRPA
jgi:hypothetical protein